MKHGILQFARTGYDTRKKYPFRLFTIDSRIDTALLFATLKITYTKIFAEKEKGALNGAFW